MHAKMNRALTFVKYLRTPLLFLLCLLPLVAACDLIEYHPYSVDTEGISDVNAAKEALREAGFAVMLTDVVCLSCANKPGALSSILDILAREEIFIEYMYAFSEGDLANVVIRPTDVEKCIDTLTNNASGIVNFNTTY